jgi:hypothetical protein
MCLWQNLYITLVAASAVPKRFKGYHPLVPGESSSLNRTARPLVVSIFTTRAIATRCNILMDHLNLLRKRKTSLRCCYLALLCPSSIAHAHTWLAPAFVREVRSLAHGMAGPTMWRAQPPVSSLQDGSQDRSQQLRLRKRCQHHHGIWHVLITLITRWQVEPTLDLFPACHLPSASSESKT